MFTEVERPQFPLTFACYVCVSVCLFLARDVSPSITALHCPYLPHQLAGESLCGGDPMRMLAEVRRIYDDKLEHAVFGVPNTRGRQCLPCLMTFERSYKHGTFNRIAMSYQAEIIRVQSAREDFLKSNKGKRVEQDSPFAAKTCTACHQGVVRGELVYDNPGDPECVGSYYQFWSRANFTGGRRGKTCGLCKLTHFASLLPEVAVEGGSDDQEEAQNPDDEDDGREKESAGGDDDRSNPEDDNGGKSRPSVNRIAKAVESMGDEGDGVTDEVAKVLDGIDAGDLADLCRESLENGWKPGADLVDRIVAGLKAALPKSQNGEDGTSGDETVDQGTCVNQRVLALDSMGDQGEGVTSAVANVLERMGEVDLARLCRKAIEEKSKPTPSLTDRVTEVLRASLPNMVQNGIAAAQTGTMNSLNTRTASGTAAEGGNGDQAPHNADRVVVPCTQGDDTAGAEDGGSYARDGSLWEDDFKLGARTFLPVAEETPTLQSRGYVSDGTAGLDSNGRYPAACSLVGEEYNFMVEDCSKRNGVMVFDKPDPTYVNPRGYAAAVAYFRPGTVATEYRHGRIYFSVDWTNHSTVDCFYEGDVDGTHRCAHGYGSLVVMPGREVYSGFFSSLHDGELEDTNAPTMGCCVQDTDVLGAEAGSSISEVVIRYMEHRMYWYRVWFPMRQEEGVYQCILESRHYKEGRNESVSVAFDESWNPFVAGAADGQPVPPASLLERLGAIANHDPEFDAIREEHPGFSRRWRGHLSLRPQSVLACEKLRCPDGTRFTHVSQWQTGDSGYEIYDSIVVSKPPSPRSRSRARIPADDLKRTVSIGTYDVTGGVVFLPDDQSPAFDDLMQLQNVRAIMYVPALHKRSRQHGGKKFTRCRVFFQGPDANEGGDLDGGKYCQLMRGLPIQMHDLYAERHFPCHWRLALAQPNTIVLIETVVERFPLRVHGHAQMLHLLLLKDLVKEDTQRRVEGEDRTSGLSYEDQSVVFPLADHVFGFHGLWVQLQELYPVDKEDELCTPPERSDGDLTHATLVERHLPSYEDWAVGHSSQTFDGFNYVMPEPKLGAANGTETEPMTLGDNDRYLYYDRRNSIKTRKLLNVRRVKFVPRCPVTPFRVELLTNGRARTRSAQEGDSNTLKLIPLGVTVSWMLEHYHRAVVWMAMDGRWRPQCFSVDKEAGDGNTATFPVYDPGATGRTVAWKHNSWLDIGKMGHTLGSEMASCVGNSVTEVLLLDAEWQHPVTVDRGALADVESWPAWMAWDSVPRRLMGLNKHSIVGRKYKAKAVPLSKGSTLERGGYGSLLLTSSLGRERLFDAGVRAMVVQPVDFQTGWARHVVAYIADSKGLWSVHDTDEAPVVLGEGPSNETSGVLAAWTVDVSVSSRGGGPPPKKKQVLRRPSGKFEFPACPTPQEARAHAVRLSVLAAFGEHARSQPWVGVFDVDAGAEVVRAIPDFAASTNPSFVWEELTSHFLRETGAPQPLDFDTVLYDSLWDPLQREDAGNHVHLLLARSGAATWCPETIYVMRCKNRQWEVYDPTAREYVKVYKTKKPLGFLVVGSVARLVIPTEPDPHVVD